MSKDMQSILVLFAILIPIFLVEYPIIFEKMGDVRGTYDVLITAIPLSRQEVFQLLPESVRQEDEEKTFFDIPDDIYDALIPIESQKDSKGNLIGKKDHFIILQLGYQINTGPGPDWLPKFSFSECKLEVPYMRHPSLLSESPMGYKQTILFSNSLIKMGSSMTGLVSKTASFDPASSPSNFDADASSIDYSVKEMIQAKAKEFSSSSTLTTEDPSWKFYQNYVQDWWFGIGTDKKVQRFTFSFDNPIISPKPYEIEIELDLNAFKPSQESTSSQLQLQKISFKGGLGWRSRAKHQINQKLLS